MIDFKEKIRQYSEKSENEVLQFLFNYWGFEFSEQPFKLIVGNYEKSGKPDKNGNEFGFFQEVRSTKGDILYYPFRLGLVSLFTMHKPNISNNDYWLIDVRLNNKATRDKISNPFALSLANNVFGKPKNTFLDLVDKEKFIRDIFNKRGATADDAGLISRAISKLAGDMYTDLSERFVFELLQNADDMPKDKNGVNVKLHLLEKNILFIHNGLPFSKEDIKAITDIGNSTKKKNPSQTGYKGIGFKIFFQESENVLIKSGGFSFSFDKNHPYYDELKKSIYSGLSNDEIPWQLKPIWTEKYRYDKEIQDNTEFMNNTTDVAIAINTDRVNQFRTDITSLIQEPRFILFLRNIKSIKIDGIKTPIEITKTKSEKAISLKSNNEHLSDWLTFDDIEIKITEEVKEAILSDKAVPPKLKEISSTKLNFICQLVDGKITPVAPEESYLFTYLPTDVKDYKFPFLVNADFLTTANRQSIHVKNKWNLFLFEEIGRNCLKWIAEVTNSSYKGSAYNLLPNIENSVNDQPWEAFYKGYTKALDDTEFILSESGKLVKIKDVCIDNTGFSKFVDSSTFKKLFNLQGELLSNEIIDVNPIISTVEDFGQGKIIKITNLIQSISNENFKAWLTKPENNIVFLRYLIDNRLLDLLASNELFLSKDLKLLKSNEILSDLGSDYKELAWLNFTRLLHPDISSSLPEISLQLKQYEPISFIKEIICKENKVEIIARLKDGTISFDDFYCYLAKYASNPLFPEGEIKQFPIKATEGILPSWSSRIFFYTSSLNKISTEKALPGGLFYLLDEKWSSNSNSNFRILAEKLGVYTFNETEPYVFIKSIICDNKDVITEYYTNYTKESAVKNAALWSFIINSFDSLSSNQIEWLKKTFSVFPILSKNLHFTALNNLYLSSTFTDNDSLENLVNKFPYSEIDFIHPGYLKVLNIDKSKIKRIFKHLDAKVETSDFLFHELLPNLDKIEEDLYVALTQIIYENRDSEKIIKAVKFNKYFKLKTKEGNYKPIKDCYLGSPYIAENLIPNALNMVPIHDQISEDYSKNHLDVWQRFFTEKLGVFKLESETELINLKLRHVANNIETWKCPRASKELFHEIYKLFKSEKLVLNSANIYYLRRIPLLCKNGDQNYFYTANSIHFSSAYKPAFDFEKIFGSECGVPFLSNIYMFEESPDIIKFFIQIGVSQSFDRKRHSAIYENIPTADGQKKPANQLFRYKFKKYVGQNNVSFIDLSQFKYNGETLEFFLGFRSKLDLETILNYITTKQPHRQDLKELIADLFKVYNPTRDKEIINAFNSKGKLLSTEKSYHDVADLHSIDESIRSGIRENKYLIDPLFNKQEHDRERYLNLFNIKNLKAEDFNPYYENAIGDFEFTKRVNDRLLFLAFDSDNENYIEVEKVYKEKFEQWKIFKCSRISLKYPATESKIIKEDSKTFEVIYEKSLYYIGSWSDPRVNPVLVDCLSKNILGLYKQRAFIQDMLLNDPSAIIEDFENKGREVPEEIKRRFIIAQPTHQDVNVPQPIHIESSIDESEIEKPSDDEFENPFKDITPDDETFIRRIIKGVFELNEKLDANTTAKIKTLMAIKGQYNASEIIDEGRFLKAGGDEIIVRSAQNGLLYLDVYHWGRLSESNVSLSIYTKSQVNIFKTTAVQNKSNTPLISSFSGLKTMISGAILS